MERPELSLFVRSLSPSYQGCGQCRRLDKQPLQPRKTARPTPGPSRGKDLTAQARAKGFEVLDTDAALKELDAALLTRFVQRAKPWER